MRVTIYWTKEGLKIRDKICSFFKIPVHITINGETSCNISDDMMDKLRATENRGLIKIRYKNGNKDIL